MDLPRQYNHAHHKWQLILFVTSLARFVLSATVLFNPVYDTNVDHYDGSEDSLITPLLILSMLAGSLDAVFTLVTIVDDGAAVTWAAWGTAFGRWLLVRIALAAAPVLIQSLFLGALLVTYELGALLSAYLVVGLVVPPLIVLGLVFWYIWTFGTESSSGRYRPVFEGTTTCVEQYSDEERTGGGPLSEAFQLQQSATDEDARVVLRLRGQAEDDASTSSGPYSDDSPRYITTDGFEAALEVDEGHTNNDYHDDVDDDELVSESHPLLTDGASGLESYQQPAVQGPSSTPEHQEWQQRRLLESETQTQTQMQFRTTPIHSLRDKNSGIPLLALFLTIIASAVVELVLVILILFKQPKNSDKLSSSHLYVFYLIRTFMLACACYFTLSLAVFLGAEVLHLLSRRSVRFLIVSHSLSLVAIPFGAMLVANLDAITGRQDLALTLVPVVTAAFYGAFVVVRKQCAPDVRWAADKNP